METASRCIGWPFPAKKGIEKDEERLVGAVQEGHNLPAGAALAGAKVVALAPVVIPFCTAHKTAS